MLERKMLLQRLGMLAAIQGKISELWHMKFILVVQFVPKTHLLFQYFMSYCFTDAKQHMFCHSLLLPLLPSINLPRIYCGSLVINVEILFKAKYIMASRTEQCHASSLKECSSLSNSCGLPILHYLRPFARGRLTTELL